MCRSRRERRLAAGVALTLCAWLAMAGPGRAQAPTGQLESRLAALEARAAIRELIYAYGRALDTRDFEAFAALFAEEEGTWIGGFGRATGREAIFALMDEAIGHADPPVQPASHHLFANIRIEVDGATATGSTRWIFVVPSAEGDPQWLFLGHYEDRFIRADGSWYFLEREAFTDVPVQPAED